MARIGVQKKIKVDEERVALTPDGHSPTLSDKDLAQAMRPGSVIVDVTIDQGSCLATSRETTQTKNNGGYPWRGVLSRRQHPWGALIHLNEGAGQSDAALNCPPLAAASKNPSQRDRNFSQA